MKRKLDPTLLPEVRKRLERNLEGLGFYCCNPDFFPRDNAATDFRTQMLVRGIPRGTGWWPEYALLEDIVEDVIVLALRERKKAGFPVWKRFEQVDKRLPKLRLKNRVDKLINRAHALLPGESELSKLVRLHTQGQTQSKLRDFLLNPEQLTAALEADRKVERLRFMAQPLARWIVLIGHPMGKDFASFTGLNPRDADFCRFYRRWQQAERARRHRLTKKSLKSVTPV